MHVLISSSNSSNGNRTEWSTIQGVIGRVISFQIPSLINTKSYYQLIESITDFEASKSLRKALCEKSQRYVQSVVQNVRKLQERTHLSVRDWRANGVVSQLQVSNLKFKLDNCDWIPTWSRADYATNRRAQNQSKSRILLLLRLSSLSSLSSSSLLLLLLVVVVVVNTRGCYNDPFLSAACR